MCQAGPAARVFSAQTEVSDELELAPVFAIALSGCDLRCDFCITGAESWNPAQGAGISPQELATRAERAIQAGARSIMVLGGEPTIHLPTALKIVAALPDSARLAWKTNGHGSARARALLAGMFDVWVVDFKFGNDQCAQRLAGGIWGTRVNDRAFSPGRERNAVQSLPSEPERRRPVAVACLRGKGNGDGPSPLRHPAPMCAGGVQGFKIPPAPALAYVATAQENLLWAYQNTKLITRHLLMPGHILCCWRPVAAWLAGNLPDVKVNLRAGFWPAWRAARHPELRGTVTPAEHRLAREIAADYHLNLIQ